MDDWESHILHEASLKQQPEHQTAGIRPPEGASDWESPFLQSLQLFLLAFAAEKTSFTWTLSNTVTWREKIKEGMTCQMRQVKTRYVLTTYDIMWQDKRKHDMSHHQSIQNNDMSWHDKTKDDMTWKDPKRPYKTQLEKAQQAKARQKNRQDRQKRDQKQHGKTWHYNKAQPGKMKSEVMTWNIVGK